MFKRFKDHLTGGNSPKPKDEVTQSPKQRVGITGEMFTFLTSNGLPADLPDKLSPTLAFLWSVLSKNHQEVIYRKLIADPKLVSIIPMAIKTAAAIPQSSPEQQANIESRVRKMFLEGQGPIAEFIITTYAKTATMGKLSTERESVLITQLLINIPKIKDVFGESIPEGNVYATVMQYCSPSTETES